MGDSATDRLDRLSRDLAPGFEAIDDLVCLLAMDGTVVRCNRKMAEFFGLQPDQVIGRSCFDLMHGSRTFFPDCPFAEMRETERRESIELPLGDRWYRVTADPVRDGDAIVGAVHIVRDVTDFREAALRAEEKSRRLQAITGLAVDLAARPRGGDLGRFLAGRLLAMSGAVAVAFSEYLPGERVLVTRAIELRQGALRRLTSPLLRRLESTRSPVSEVVLAEILAAPMGLRSTLTEASFGDIPASVDRTVRRVLDVDRFLGVPYVIEGELYGTSVLALEAGAPDPPRDLVEAFSHLAAVSLRQERAERDAVLAAAQLDSFFELSTDILAILDLDGVVRRVNPAWETILGWRREEVEGHAATEFVHPDDVDSSLVQLRALSRGAAIVDYVVRQPHKDGTLREIEWRVTPYGGRLGFAIGRDVTRRTEEEEQIKALNADLERRVVVRTRELATANRDLQEFVYSVAHDLRTPLRAMDGFSLAVLEEHGDAIGEEGRGDLRRARAAAQTMGELIDALLSLAHIAQIRPTLARVDLTEVARRVLDGLRAADPGRVVEATIAEGLEAVTDEALAEVVLQNLLGNAWKFTTPNPVAHIEFGCTSPDGLAEFFVRDDGVGFPPEYAGKLFLPFQRLHTDERFGGTGIGLATVARALERLGGTWRAESATDRGAAFYFTFGDGTAPHADPRD